MQTRSLTIPVLAGALLLNGCATATPGSAMERANMQCVGTVIVGALLGAAIGNNTGSGDGSRGALIGAGAGGVMCAILRAMASEEDQRRMEETKILALEAGERREVAYVGADGSQRKITVDATPIDDPMWTSAASATDAAAPASASASSGLTEQRICRTSQMTLEVEGVGAQALGSELFCRDPVSLAWTRQSARG